MARFPCGADDTFPSRANIPWKYQVVPQIQQRTVNVRRDVIRAALSKDDLVHPSTIPTVRHVVSPMLPRPNEVQR
jgi:hypothetical protein